MSREHVPVIEQMADDIAARMRRMAQDLEAQERLVDEVTGQLTAARRIIADLLRHVGQRRICKGPNCKQEIYVVLHRDSGHFAPYNADGTNHYITCADREIFRAGRHK